MSERAPLLLGGLVAAVLLSSAAVRAAGPPSDLAAALGEVPAGRLLRLVTSDRHDTTGVLVAADSAAVTLGTEEGDAVWTLPLDRIAEVWERGRATREGLRIGGTTLGAIGAVLFGLAGAALSSWGDPEGDPDPWITLASAGLGGVAGGTIGGVLGAGAGALVPRWNRIHPPPDAATPDPLPADGGTTARPDLGVGAAAVGRDGAPAARGLLRLGLLSPASGRLRAGPELGFASTAYEREERRGGVLVRSGYQNAWYAAMRGHYDLLGTPLRPFVTLGLGWQWRDQADPAWIAGGGVAYRLEGAPVTWCLEWRILASLTDRPEGGDEPLYTGTFGLRFH